MTAAPETPRIRRKRPAKPQFAQTMLILEAFCVFFATLVAYGLRIADPAWIWGVGGGLTLVLLLISGMVGRRGGYAAGWVVQVWVVAAALVLPSVARGMALVVAAVFITLWAVSLRLGGRIDAERAAYDAAHPGEVGP
ncbi:DUF4233 domain-containing protein [Cellulomonas edaphi]|uniref:DUF4233 domain-containing protein n=1 Tax=Cellulomonas edaphi TaxID=3053468 RepID=A0ABT7SAM7_9CELL|nr:DUF4233 domain-containing protein [Cellulomons edaphi]MDM7832679.1 DUF4233 domain-containing protein [Cellulomons edaphi]